MIMLFTPENAQKSVAGLKTNTLRLKKSGDLLEEGDEACLAVYRNNGRKRWAVGDQLAICPGRGKHQIGKLEIVGLRSMRVQDITEEMAVAEGCRATTTMNKTGTAMIARSARDNFIILWDSINKKAGTRWADNPEVWSITYRCIERKNS